MTNVNEKSNITSTDERLQVIAERFKPGDDRCDCGEPNGDLARFAARKALEARDLLRQAAKCVKGICALTGADVSKVPLIQKINKALES